MRLSASFAFGVVVLIGAASSTYAQPYPYYNTYAYPFYQPVPYPYYVPYPVYVPAYTKPYYPSAPLPSQPYPNSNSRIAERLRTIDAAPDPAVRALLLQNLQRDMDRDLEMLRAISKIGSAGVR